MGVFNGEITDSGYEPSLLHKWLSPRVSGNDVNGLGETEVRRPKKIFHYATQTFRFPFFWLNIWFIIRSLMVGEGREPFKRALDLHNTAKAPHPVADKRVDRSPEQWSQDIKEFALANGADIVGVTQLDPNWLFEDTEAKGQWLIMMGFLMDYENIKTLPEVTGLVEVLNSYAEGGDTADKLAAWIGEQGFEATGGCLMPDYLNQNAAAIAAGLGELGKHGSVIHRESGAAIRFAHVAVDFPVAEDEADDFYLDDFCGTCQVCTKACPAQAISDEKQMVRGEEKWYVDYDKCLPYFIDANGCGICVSECPFSIPTRAPIISGKLQRRRERKQQAAGDSN